MLNGLNGTVEGKGKLNNPNDILLIYTFTVRMNRLNFQVHWIKINIEYQTDLAT